MDALIRHAGDGHMPPHRRAALVERAAGNPLYLTELLGADADELSTTLESVIAAQIDRLAPADRRLLRHAAVLGSRFDLGLLAVVADEPWLATAGARVITGRLQWLCIPEGRGRLRFRHQLIRDVAYASLPFRQRRALHERAADALTELAPAEYGLLSLHYERASRHEACWRTARAAAKRACDTFANVEAVELFERAISAARHLPYLPDEELSDVWHQLGERHAFLGSMTAARAAYRRARRHARNDPVAFAVACLKEARAAEREASTAAMDRWIKRGLHALTDLTTGQADGLRAELLTLGAWSKLVHGRLRQAERWATRAIESGERAGDVRNAKRAVAYAYSVFDNVDAALGREADPARAARALEIFRELGDLSAEAVLLNNLGMDAYYRGRWLEAVRLFERSREAMTKTGNVNDAGYGSLNIAEILVEQGRLDEAESTLAELEPLWHSVDHALGLAYVDNHRGRIRLHRGDTEAAIALLTQAREVFERNQLVIDALDADARAAECRLRLGRVADARALLEAALSRDHATGGTRVAARLHRVLAYVALAEGDVTTAWASMDESLAVARRVSSTYDVALALEGFEVLATGAERDVHPDVTDRIALLDELGVVATPSPPVVARLASV
jgi:tetratricopeptide (TPR) repeat protein